VWFHVPVSSSSGGTVETPLERTASAELFGACVDRYGVRWMVDDTGEVVFGAN